MEEAPEPDLAPSRSWTDCTTGPTKLVIKNISGKRVQLVWLSYDGAEQVYNVIEDGQEAHQDTYSTHIWELRDEDGVRIVQYAGPPAKLYVLQTGVSIIATPAAAAAAAAETGEPPAAQTS
ncbi:hypothetical protein VOLCADRAFT_104804 [Volvox carteri f. nagariensis]|uniref:von Hippel-Lindau disease tumour suppressor beta domain-containing protein n=1 Tax=Volvox carteri f. nagariensis TaxID=3068 RepID=D8TW72_VOLCA|nr:uncharacterized protein VOLCADRAFT_104804 [Volvox carteri f. nagariensis]EFJ48322.1 hypothetical protein VOLCADRAFT_104804 [Volvox carteri f. nagariensis]|eukprot:XP_002950576.1 hypothetical protein VOLCADRAFT_104804 [Volvox carteri f. nagariensis]